MFLFCMKYVLLVLVVIDLSVVVVLIVWGLLFGDVFGLVSVLLLVSVMSWVCEMVWLFGLFMYMR